MARPDTTLVVALAATVWMVRNKVHFFDTILLPPSKSRRSGIVASMEGAEGDKGGGRRGVGGGGRPCQCEAAEWLRSCRSFCIWHLEMSACRRTCWELDRKVGVLMVFGPASQTRSALPHDGFVGLSPARHRLARVCEPNPNPANHDDELRASREAKQGGQ